MRPLAGCKLDFGYRERKKTKNPEQNNQSVMRSTNILTLHPEIKYRSKKHKID